MEPLLARSYRHVRAEAPTWNIGRNLITYMACAESLVKTMVWDIQCTDSLVKMSWKFGRAPGQIANVMSFRQRNKLHVGATLRVRVTRLWSAFQVQARASVNLLTTETAAMCPNRQRAQVCIGVMLYDAIFQLSRQIYDRASDRHVLACSTVAADHDQTWLTRCCSKQITSLVR